MYGYTDPYSIHTSKYRPLRTRIMHMYMYMYMYMSSITDSYTHILYREEFYMYVYDCVHSFISQFFPAIKHSDTKGVHSYNVLCTYRIILIGF